MNNTSKFREVYVPIFREDQVNKRLDENGMPTNEIKPIKEILQDEVSYTISAALDAFGDENGPFIFMCVMEKTDVGAVIGIMGTNINTGNPDELNIKIPKMTLSPKITISGKEG
jgi:hypothetical protein